MKNERLLHIMGMVDDQLINRAEIATNRNKYLSRFKIVKWNYKKLAIAAALIIICLSVCQLTPVKAMVDEITEWVQQITENYNMDNLETYKIKVNQSRSINGITMNVEEVILEKNALMAKCNFCYDDRNRKNDFVQTSEWPFNVSISQAGKNLAKIENPNDIITAAYNEADGSIKVLFTIDLKRLKNVSDLLGKETVLSFYYNKGVLNGKTYDFKFLPRKIYKEQSYSMSKNHRVDSYGSFTISKVTKEALYLEIDIQSELKCAANEEFDFKLVDKDGTEYYQQRKFDNGKYYFNSPDNLNKAIYLELVLMKFNNRGVRCDEAVLGKYPL